MPPFSEQSSHIHSDNLTPPYPLLRTTGTHIDEDSTNGDSPRVGTKVVDRSCFVPRQTTVRFDPKPTVHHVLHYNNYSPQETANTWYSKKEVKIMKKDNRRAAKGNFKDMCISIPKEQLQSWVDKDEAVPRGLESKTVVGAIRKRRHKVHAWSIVFSQQRHQKENGKENPEALADAYFEATELCRIQAYLVALRDARDVQAMVLREKQQKRQQKEQQKRQQQQQRQQLQQLQEASSKENLQSTEMECASIQSSFSCSTEWRRNKGHSQEHESTIARTLSMVVL